jgi:carbonic anhydrase/acetyltransferase-like protein (isoleucine patch superfamily)
MSDLIDLLNQHLRKAPTLGKHVYIAQSAVVVGDVTIGDSSSVWYNAVLRGDINRIAVGHHSNIQDNTVVHLAEDLPCLIGSQVTIGHSAIVHACTVEDGTLIGMGSTILDGAVIGAQSIVGANTLVPQRMRIPPNSLAIGFPARVVRRLTAEESAGLVRLAEKYAANAAYCLKHRINVGSPMGRKNGAGKLRCRK